MSSTVSNELVSQEGTASKVTRRLEMTRVVDQIDHLCAAFGVGARLPAYRDLMARFNTSERTVLGALAELQRRGRIVRRAGSGTYVADVTGLLEAHSVPKQVNSDDRQGCTSIVLIATHDNAYFSRGIELFYEQANILGLQISYQFPHIDQINNILGAPNGSQRGFVVLGSSNYELSERIHDAGERVVYLGDMPIGAQVRFSCVNADHLHGGYLAADHLINLGHRRIANVLPLSPARARGHREAVHDAREAGLDVTTFNISAEQWKEWRTRPELVAEFFKSPTHPTGLCVWNDHDCISLLTILLSAQIQVPEQISLVGYDNGWEAKNVTPALTTVDNKLEDRIKIALDLLSRPVSSAPCFTAIVQPELVVRATTSRCAH